MVRALLLDYGELSLRIVSGESEAERAWERRLQGGEDITSPCVKQVL